MTESSIYEIAICKIKEGKKDQLNKIRKSSLEYLVKNYDGLISITPLDSIDKENTIGDLCQWKSADLAKSASEKVMSDPNLTAYFETIESVLFFDHFSKV